VIHFFWDRIIGTYRRPDAGRAHANDPIEDTDPVRRPCNNR
jgi:hypothetical protein